MRLYYTGSELYLGKQTNIDKSIGGYVSESAVPNNQIGNLFSDISYYGIQNGAIETKGVILKNEHPSGDLTNVNFYYEFAQTENLCTFEFAFVTLIDSDKQMEKIPNYKSLPLYATFVNPLEVANKVLVDANFTANKTIGLWVKRTVDQSLLDKSCEEIAALLENIEKKSYVNLIFEFD